MVNEGINHHNRERTVQFIYRHPHATRTEIYKGTGMTPATVSQTVAQLITENMVVETGQEVSGTGSGRKQKVIELNQNFGYCIGVDFSLSGMATFVCDILGNPLSSNLTPYEQVQNQDINGLIAEKINSIVKNYPHHKFLGVGVAIPGHYDGEHQTIISNNPMWNTFDLSKIRLAISLPILAENNIESMALARFLFDSANTPDKFLFLHSGYGLYAAFIEPNSLHPKRNYYIGEIGHTVVNPDGFQCECGKRGCLQTYISETWILKKARLLYRNSNTTVLRSLVADPTKINLDTVLAAYDLGDSFITQSLNQAVRYLGISVANLLMMCDADAIYLNSRILQKPEFHQQISETISTQLTFIPTKKNTTVAILPYQETAAARGACALVALAKVVQNSAYADIMLP
ncbi:ROK family transcriptional regulator [Schleiferilactobacillus perolens]|nr:ROK family transcriptional regulator [Schleiferilactobacillus perolens]